jgi:hypothetical protein
VAVMLSAVAETAMRMGRSSRAPNSRIMVWADIM